MGTEGRRLRSGALRDAGDMGKSELGRHGGWGMAVRMNRMENVGNGWPGREYGG